MNEDARQDIKVLLEIREAYRLGVSDRVSNVWKINLALWAALGAFAGTAVSGKAAGFPSRSWCVLGVLLLIVLVTYIWWTVYVALKNDKDALTIMRLDEEVKELRGGLARAQGCDDRSIWKRIEAFHSQLLQIAFSVFLSALAVVAALGSFAPSGKTIGEPTSQHTERAVSINVDMSEK